MTGSQTLAKSCRQTCVSTLSLPCCLVVNKGLIIQNCSQRGVLTHDLLRFLGTAQSLSPGLSFPRCCSTVLIGLALWTSWDILTTSWRGELVALHPSLFAIWSVSPHLAILLLVRHIDGSAVTFEWILGTWRKELIMVASKTISNCCCFRIKSIKPQSIPISACSISRDLSNWLHLSLKLPLDKCHPLLEHVCISPRKCI